jgi:alkanesulfonate monooxygenase SsuD/methylene tetrahydromethanopterin reductase-like flavin-dependent oxidoreductase (luciferase family)
VTPPPPDAGAEEAAGRGFGVAAGLDPAVAGPLAKRCIELGYGSLWSNDTPVGSGLETVSAFAAAVPGVELGVTLAVDRHSPAELAAKVDELGLDREQLWLGVGAGTSERPLTRMRKALPELREALPGVRLALAAMGPKMLALGGSDYDGVFTNWMPPAAAAEARERVHAAAGEAGREPPPVLGYVRTAVGPDADARLTKEESFYRDLHDGYRNHFERLGARLGEVGIASPDSGSAQQGLREYEGVLDLIVVRALASAKVDAMSALAEAAAPQPS